MPELTSQDLENEYTESLINSLTIKAKQAIDDGKWILAATACRMIEELELDRTTTIAQAAGQSRTLVDAIRERTVAVPLIRPNWSEEQPLYGYPVGVPHVKPHPTCIDMSTPRGLLDGTPPWRCGPDCPRVAGRPCGRLDNCELPLGPGILVEDGPGYHRHVAWPTPTDVVDQAVQRFAEPDDERLDHLHGALLEAEMNADPDRTLG